MRGETFTRQLRLLQLLEARREGLEPEEAAQELGTGKRTVYRDFRVLEDAGIPLRSEQEGKRARWKMMEGYRHRLQLSLTWSEMLALSVGSKLLEGLSGTLFHTSAVSALEKLRASFPRELAERIRAQEAQVSAPAGGREYQPRQETVRLLVEAIDRRWTLAARYRSRTGRSPLSSRRERRMDPYHLRVSGQGLYVLARCHRAREVRTFLVDRFQSLRSTGESFEVAPDFRPQELLATAFEMWSGPARRVRLVVASSMADLLMERKVHTSQMAQRRADGALEVQLEVAVGPPLVSWLVGLGAALLEVEPEQVRQQVCQAHREAMALLESGR
jgi:predicted DNA-binding transcriptional regulator YafY